MRLDEIKPTSQAVKLLLLGNSGVGKTGALGSLAKAYRLVIADFDAGYDILLDPMVVKPEHRKNVYIKTFIDLVSGPKAIPKGGAKALLNFHQALLSWDDLGPISSWGPDTVFAIDSLTFLSRAAELHVASINNRLGEPLRIQDYGAAQDLIEGVVAMLYSPTIRCHVVVTAHLQRLSDETGANKWFPQTTGVKLSTKIPRFFNNAVCIVKDATGKRVLHTSATPQADLKTSRPSSVPSTMEPDLAKLFALLLAE